MSAAGLAALPRWLRKESVSVWGAPLPQAMVELGETEIVDDKGCISETCNHVSHDPAAPVRRWTPRQGRIVVLDWEDYGDWGRTWYALVNKDSVLLFFRVTSTLGYWDNIRVVAREDLPGGAKATLDEIGLGA